MGTEDKNTVEPAEEELADPQGEEIEEESKPEEPSSDDMVHLEDQQELTNTEEELEPGQKKGFGLLKWLVLPAVLAVVYIGGALFFQYYSVPNTFVNGRDVSMQKLSEIDPLEQVVPESITIQKKDGSTAVLEPQSIDMTLSLEEPLVISQNSYRWPMAFFDRAEYDSKILHHYDEAKFDAFIDANFIKDTTTPQDAKIELVDGVYKIIPAVEGNTIDKAVVTQHIMDGIDASQTELNLSEFYDQPSIREDDEKLQKALAEIEAYTNRELAIDFIFKQEIMDQKVLSSFVELGEDLSITVNQDKLHEYVVNLATQYDTYDKPRPFESTYRGLIEVPPGIYGWLMNVEETEALIVQSLEDGTTAIEPIYEITGTIRTEDGWDIGSTYIEVDLSNQTMWYYEAGELILSTPVVTGDPTRGVATPPGANVVWHKERDKPLEGVDPNGNWYVAPVDYWMAVDWSHTGIHNARWRENAGGFGGNIFMGNGSFGCINTPYNDVATLYEMVQYGTPVMMYE